MKPVRYEVAENGCHEFIGCLHATGYGKVSRNGKTYLAHRFAWLQHYGELPLDLCVLHRCDNKKCVNPGHLFLGTRTDNMQDMIKKGRARFVGLKSPNYRPPTPQKGELNGRAKLTQSDVDRIKSMRGQRQIDIAAAVGISRPTVQRILAGKGWRHTGDFT